MYQEKIIKPVSDYVAATLFLGFLVLSILCFAIEAFELGGILLTLNYSWKRNDVDKLWIKKMIFYRHTYRISGTVQGIGFRPHLYRLAEKHGVCGWVKNLSGSVMLCFEGGEDAVN